jgi:tetratricopeptide (TPR) repeat protein
VLRFFVALALLLLGLPGAARGQTSWPEEAERRFQEALELASQGKHEEAAKAYRSVADWPSGGDFRERARALYRAAAELESARDLERALETYREVAVRFPKSDFVAVADRAAEALAPKGVAGGLDFRRRHEAALDVLLPAMTLARREPAAARPDLERALALLLALAHDYPAHPRATDVLVAISDVLVRLERLDEAVTVAEQALALAENVASGAHPSSTAPADVVSARRQVAEARRAVWCRSLDRDAKVLLAVIALALGWARGWRRLTPRLVRAWIGLLAADVVLAALAAAAAEWVRRRENVDTLVGDDAAAALVLVPGGVGITVAFLSPVSRRGRLGAALTAVASVLGALATTVCLVHHYGFFSAFFSD